jgi:transposase-like protein
MSVKITMREETIMPRRKWDPQTKSAIVLQGLKGERIKDICTEHNIRPVHYYQWRDKYLKNLPEIFSNTKHRETSLIRKNNRLKKALGKVIAELEELEILILNKY